MTCFKFNNHEYDFSSPKVKVDGMPALSKLTLVLCYRNILNQIHYKFNPLRGHTVPPAMVNFKDAPYEFLREILLNTIKIISSAESSMYSYLAECKIGVDGSFQPWDVIDSNRMYLVEVYNKNHFHLANVVCKNQDDILQYVHDGQYVKIM